MEDIIGSSLRKVVKGAAIYFVGTILGLVISFFARVLVVRYVTPSEFGVLSFSVVVFTVVCTIATLGIPEALTRQASYLIGRGEEDKAKAVFKISACILLILGLLSALALFLFSSNIAKFFGMADLCWTLKIFSVAVPIAIINRYLMAVFRTCEKAEIKVVFSNIIPNLLRFILVVLVILLGLSFYFVVWVYALAIIITGFLFVIYSQGKIDFRTSDELIKYIKTLILLSLYLC